MSILGSGILIVGVLVVLVIVCAIYVGVTYNIANSRKYYNSAVRNLNNKVLMFPSNIVASMFGFQESNMFEIDAEEKNNVKVEF